MDKDAMLTAYGNIMQEVRWRLDSIFLIEGQLGKSLNTLQHFIANETYLLQLRMTFECIALGCMLVHGDIPITRSGNLTKAYQADLLLKELGEVHADFFPVSRHGWKGSFDGPPGVAFGSPLTQGAITRKEIISLYSKYGDYLHRGRFKTLEPIRQNTTKPLGKEIGNTARALATLLRVHTIRIYGTKTEFVGCILDPVKVGYFNGPLASV